MDIEKYVCSLELSQKLEERGLKFDTYFYHVIFSRRDEETKKWKEVAVQILTVEEIQVELRPEDGVVRYRAFNLSELGNIIPVEYFNKIRKNITTATSNPEDMLVTMYEFSDGEYQIYDENEANVRAGVVDYLLEKGEIIL